MTRRQIAFVLGCILSSAANADATDKLCRSVESNVNLLADFTSTKCLATAGKTKGAITFLIISEKPVFSSEKAKKGWLVVACAAAGSELNKAPSVRAEELWFTDVTRTKERIAYAAPAASCKALQSKVRAGSITIDQFYASLSSQLVRKVASR